MSDHFNPISAETVEHLIVVGNAIKNAQLALGVTSNAIKNAINNRVAAEPEETVSVEDVKLIASRENAWRPLLPAGCYEVVLRTEGQDNVIIETTEHTTPDELADRARTQWQAGKRDILGNEWARVTKTVIRPVAPVVAPGAPDTSAPAANAAQAVADFWHMLSLSFRNVTWYDVRLGDEIYFTGHADGDQSMPKLVGPCIVHSISKRRVILQATGPVIGLPITVPIFVRT